MGRDLAWLIWTVHNALQVGSPEWKAWLMNVPEGATLTQSASSTRSSDPDKLKAQQENARQVSRSSATASCDKRVMQRLNRGLICVSSFVPGGRWQASAAKKAKDNVRAHALAPSFNATETMREMLEDASDPERYLASSALVKARHLVQCRHCGAHGFSLAFVLLLLAKLHRCRHR
jgi:hypothetical protein